MLKSISEEYNLIEKVDLLRVDANRFLNENKSELGQFMTPAPIARFMASLFQEINTEMRLLEPGAGIGSLISAFAERALIENFSSFQLIVDAYEIENTLIQYLSHVFSLCEKRYQGQNSNFISNIFKEDFIEHGVKCIVNNQVNNLNNNTKYTHCIVNPPYKKIKSNSYHRLLLQKVGIESTNTYSAFLALAINLLKEGGELVAIVPRSFCNGVYFKSFREYLLTELSIRHLHTFESRNRAFSDDNVLQENIIIYGIKSKEQGKVTITSSFDSNFEGITYRQVNFDKVVNTNDSEKFIHIAINDFDQKIIDCLGVFSDKLSDRS